MKNIKGRFAAVLIVALLAVLVLPGCTDATGNDDPGSEPASVSQPVSQPAAASTAPGGASETEPEEEQDWPISPMPNTFLPPDNLPPYSIPKIDQPAYQGAYYTIEFKDLPENDAEQLVCGDYLVTAIGDGGEQYSRWMLGPMSYFPERGEDYTTEPRDDYQWVRVDKVQTLTVDEMKTAGWADGGIFENWRRQLGGGLDYDAYVEMLVENGCVMVQVDYENLYTEEKKAMGPQLDDGPHTELWLLAPDAEGRLKLYDVDRFFGEYGVPPYAEQVPAAIWPEKPAGA